MNDREKILAAPEILRRARDFSNAANIEIGVLPYGEDVIHSGPPYQQYAGAWVTYDITFTSLAEYGLWIEYAALDSRPCGIYWDNKFLPTGTIGSTTGGWEEMFQRWEKQGVISGGAGIHVLKIQRHDAIPHIRTIKLVRENG